VVDVGIVATVCLFYITYHLISKARGNEQNPSMNNYGLVASMIMIVSPALYLFDYGSFLFAPKWRTSWFGDHYIFYHWNWWVANACYLIGHWIFNFRYLKSSFRLPLLFEIAEIYAERLEKAVK